ncbi:hypothetical protein GMES_0216 [Paraglaciecola mesophila KMM 241]|uniref:Uncharacterized protein n=1 Tax=Paraglaciecola mesophila KMM 241 TaxID=1128912 RepID=K6ZGL3_9ALTE|nr:hypothetical protein GMES_0216 [Paraglaciecola mesophila KMM 241]
MCNASKSQTLLVHLYISHRINNDSLCEVFMKQALMLKKISR